MADDVINTKNSNSKWQTNLMKSGLYRSLGFYSGYYHYGETEEGASIMHLDMLMFGIIGQIGAVSQIGIKLEGTLRINYALGAYTGSVLDPDNADRNEKESENTSGATAGDIELKAGYNILNNSQKLSLYLQSGIGYHYNRTEFIFMDRLQGYLYVPIELDGELALNNRFVLTYGGGYRYLIFGNHLSKSSKYGYDGDIDVKQRNGYGLNAFIGLNFFTKAGELRNLKLVYEYWDIGASPPVGVHSIYTNKLYGLYEPKNVTHRLFLQYSFGF